MAKTPNLCHTEGRKHVRVEEFLNVFDGEVKEST
jgi:hypothetical protein